jgi:K+-sensing histidine kinase KdpD
VIATVIAVILALLLVAREIQSRRRMRLLLEELDSLRSQQKDSDRLVNVGQLVSGLAQDLKSPLQGMLGSVEVLSASDGPGTHAALELKQIRDNVTRAAGIVRNLLAFTETTELDRRWDDLDEIVRRAVQQHRTGAGPGDGVGFQGTGHLQLVYVDARQIEKVVLTLLAHTMHGVQPGATGAVAVSTHRKTSPTDHMVVDIDDPRATAGDDDEDVTWSGDLDACRRVLQAHSGLLEVERLGAGGVRFHMELPITELAEKQAL